MHVAIIIEKRCVLPAISLDECSEYHLISHLEGISIEVLSICLCLCVPALACVVLRAVRRPLKCRRFIYGPRPKSLEGGGLECHPPAASGGRHRSLTSIFFTPWGRLRRVYVPSLCRNLQRSALKYKRESRKFLYQTFLFRFF